MVTQSAEETRAAGRAFARQLQPGDIVLLEGPLGSGKTLFVQGIAEGFGAALPVTSPSFVLLQEYPLGAGRVLRHLDLYRISDPAVDLDRMGLSELLDDPQAITVVEWADRLPKDLLRSDIRALRVRIAHGEKDDERIIVTDPPDHISR